MTDFEAIADWWDDLVGNEGNDHHRLVIAPAMLRLLGEIRDCAALDVGCGNGVASRHLARAGANVIGADLSPSLIDHAERREAAGPLGVRYIVADAANVADVGDGTMDVVTANMVLMDLNNASGIIRETARVLRPTGRFVWSILHPCFQVPGGSSWLVERTDFGEQHAVKVWRYYDVFDAPGLVAAGQPAPHIYSHRPLSWYARELTEAGFVITGIDEPRPGPEFVSRRPTSRSLHLPWFLVVAARKQ